MRARAWLWAGCIFFTSFLISCGSSDTGSDGSDGSAFSRASRRPCIDTQLCIIGFHWSPTQCACVPNGSCRHDTDCRVFSDYCTGCDCRALAAEEDDPSCDGPGVRCFADPCLDQSARCIAWQCTLTARRPHGPHRPHAKHGPHVPRH